MKAHRTLMLVVCLSVTACYIGGNAARWSIARNVAGPIVQIRTQGGTLQGELVSVRDDGVIAFLSDGRVALVPWNTITTMYAKELGGEYQYGYNVGLYDQAKKNLRMVSLYPYGMSPEIQARYLASKGQTALVVLQ